VVEQAQVAATALDDVRQVAFIGTVDGGPVCATFSIHRYEHNVLLQRTRASGRWFVRPETLSAQTLAGLECT
jgi:hypothetical protein